MVDRSLMAALFITMLQRVSSSALRSLLPSLAAVAVPLDPLSLQQRWASNASAGTKVSTDSVAASSSVQPSEEVASIICKQPSTKLGESDIGSFYSVQTSLLTEALHADPSKVPQGAIGRSCAGMEDEIATSRTPAIMYRQSIAQLHAAVQQPGTRLLLGGPLGSGKSVALASLVEWARASGWVVMYIPSAAALTRGGYFLQRTEGGQYDTILSAQYILRCLVQAHSKQLASMPSPAPSSSAPDSSKAPDSGLKTVGKGSLLDVANEGLQTDSNFVAAVEACLAVKDGLLATAGTGSDKQPRVLIAIDDYNMLHWRTEYGRTGQSGKREPLTVEDLTLASRMRVLAESEHSSGAVIVGANTCSRGVSPRMEVPTAPSVTQMQIPRYSVVEAAHALYWYWECGLAPRQPTKRQVQLLHSLTNGNAKEVRELAPKLTLLASGML